MADDSYLDSNRTMWDELADLHAGTAYYDVAGFLAGRNVLNKLERTALEGEVAGRSLLHLQCHFGLDTLSWARLGARVTGVDFSPKAIALARRLAEQAGIDARFVESDVLRLPDVLDEQFDIVYTSYGALIWLPDLAPWGQVIARFLKPGGTFFIAEFHPFSYVFADASDFRPTTPYWNRGAPVEWRNEGGSYADRDAPTTHPVSYEWPHALEEIFGALLAAGLRIEGFREYPFSVDKFYDAMEQDGDGYWRLTQHAESIPLMFSLRATKPLD